MIVNTRAILTGCSQQNSSGHGIGAAIKTDVILEWAGTNWCAYAPDLDDTVIATGKTREEAITRFRDALRGLINYKSEEGLPVPNVTELEIRETVAA